ncbi:hypothetical protein IAQ61_007404 [Plenodomus lingam]|uniref:uncharacterized protein n=1 Tax=Leptosphaeria maculans TaxID=5022 RepID=UPI0033220797|nr:hypothetical protein IAQ61_007404 [Plenodomus lingam]
MIGLGPQYHLLPILAVGQRVAGVRGSSRRRDDRRHDGTVAGWKMWLDGVIARDPRLNDPHQFDRQRQIVISTAEKQCSYYLEQF